MRIISSLRTAITNFNRMPNGRVAAYVIGFGLPLLLVGWLVSLTGLIWSSQLLLIGVAVVVYAIVYFVWRRRHPDVQILTSAHQAGSGFNRLPNKQGALYFICYPILLLVIGWALSLTELALWVQLVIIGLVIALYVWMNWRWRRSA